MSLPDCANYLLTDQLGVGCHHRVRVVLRRVDHEVCHRVLRLDHLYKGGDSCERSGSRVIHFRAKWCNRVLSPHRNLACSHSSKMQSRFLSRVLNLQCLPRIGGGISLHRRIFFGNGFPRGGADAIGKTEHILHGLYEVVPFRVMNRIRIEPKKQSPVPGSH